MNGVKTKFYWDGANIKNEGTASTVNATNYFGANGVFARKSGSESDTLYKNGHGDTVLLTSGNTVVRDYEYDAYGKEKNTLPSDDNPFRYTGEYFDSETGFIYLRNRYYSPSIGRFISEDTHWNVENSIYGDEESEFSTDVFKAENEATGKLRKDEAKSPESAITIPYAKVIVQSGNLYLYALNNPEQYVDPEGDEGIVVAAVVVLAIIYIYCKAYASDTGQKIYSGASDQDDYDYYENYQYNPDDHMLETPYIDSNIWCEPYNGDNQKR